MDIQNAIIDVIASTLEVDKTLITPTLEVGGIEQWDSMGNVAVLAAIEEQLDIEIPIEDLFELNSVASIVQKVKELKDDKPHS